LEDPGVDGRILRYLFRNLDEGIERNDLVHDRYRWVALVNAVMKLRVPWHAGNFFTR
jgi:hypothetical protein